MKRNLWYVAKGLEGIGLLLVLAGLLMSIQLGMDEQALDSMAYEGKGLLFGGGLFFVGWLLERSLGTR